jgi:site-specific recombinase XerD
MDKNLKAVKENGNGMVRELAARIARESPDLADLSPKQLEVLAKAVVFDDLKNGLKRRADLARIDYQSERKTFLAVAGRTRSPHTRRAYSAALDRLDTWAEAREFAVLEIKPKDADDYAYSLRVGDRASASVRRDLAAASSFFTWLERRHESIRNPFRGSKARPEQKAKKEIALPSEAELKIILESLPPIVRAAAVVMASRGLRVGALPGLKLRAGRFTTISKGKRLSGELPVEALVAIKKTGLGAQPFANTSAAKLADSFRYTVEKLAGKLAARYSVHDLRHLYAVRQYQASPDIYKLKNLLGHASIQVTERYLKGLEVL